MPPSITDPLNESFTYDIDWGDGRQEELASRRGRYERLAGRALHAAASAARISMPMTAPTPSRSRSTTTTAACTCSTFEVIVLNVNPSFVPPSGGGSFEGDEVSSEGITTIRVDFKDPGFDNTANPNRSRAANGDRHAARIVHACD